jgi:DNA-binding NarL/FixJ family response regulator
MTSKRDIPLIVILLPLIAIQVASAIYFSLKILSDLFVWQILVIPWEIVEILEILASIGMFFGVISSLILLRKSARQMRHAEQQINAAAGEIHKQILLQFDDWCLTPTERDVALLVIKGFSNNEIASFRNTRESTIKSHITSIFRKSGLNNRQQLITHVIDDLLHAVNPE